MLGSDESNQRSCVSLSDFVYDGETEDDHEVSDRLKSGSTSA